MNATDPFELDDGAYVLGALSASERAAFETHLLTCADCRERVRQARAASSMLDGLRVSDLVAPAPPPAATSSAPTGTGRTRRALLALGGLAAAAVVAFGAVAVASFVDGGSPATTAMTPLVDTPVRAAAALVPKRWGTEIEVDCEYRTVPSD
ncbi:zf-HC2 domain-containing protein, partial [Motilibacter deserti]|uniref:zf-HC2 domain-containing protein n=1 Tax=Motilibacter deserti TaxID=2714956 RepID=UPI001407A1AF